MRRLHHILFTLGAAHKLILPPDASARHAGAWWRQKRGLVCCAQALQSASGPQKFPRRALHGSHFPGRRGLERGDTGEEAATTP